ncbi:hypothetical protein BYT27DRAFT_7263371 [Phlegmacium glaucopus]|nr:hypothetical protein BYT27DRAFT_7263371 [Phlegmacium glaucopus]
MESLPLPNVLVTLDTICIVDVTGIEGANLLWWTLLATLWEHDYCGGHSDIIISDSNRYKVVLSPKQLFSLCQNCGGSLKLFAYPSMSSVVRPGCLITEPSHWYRAPDVVVTVFSHFPKKFVCTVHLAGAESVGIILDRIVKELQCHHYYVSNRGTGPISEHRGEGIVRGSAAAFYGHFREDIGPDGSLKLYVDAYQARAAKRIIKQQPGINDLNVPGKGLPRIAVTIVARRRLVCTVVLTGIDDPPMIRQRIIEALRFYGYLIRPDLVITQTDCSAEMTYSPLTDDELFSLCREQGDKHGSLNLFVEASTLVYAPEYERPQRGPLPNIVIRVLDWDNQQPYFDMNMTGLETYEVYRVLCNESQILADPMASERLLDSTGNDDGERPL